MQSNQLMENGHCKLSGQASISTTTIMMKKNGIINHQSKFPIHPMIGELRKTLSNNLDQPTSTTMNVAEHGRASNERDQTIDCCCRCCCEDHSMKHQQQEQQQSEKPSAVPKSKFTAFRYVFFVQFFFWASSTNVCFLSSEN